MAETTDDVRRDIELTRERISSTLSQLEQKTNVVQMIKDHPWPALAVAFGAGVMLSGSRADVKAAAATLAATKGTSSRLGTVLDDVVANLMAGVTDAFHGHIDTIVNEVKTAIGAPRSGAGGSMGHGLGLSSAGGAGASTGTPTTSFGASGFAGDGAAAGGSTVGGASAGGRAD
jgi:hypothetical protein